MATVLITGGTGLVGRALTSALLEKGYELVILTRNPDAQPARTGVRYAGWDVDKQVLDPGVLDGVDHIIHLAGAGVADERWTDRRKREILDSRVKSGHLLVRVLRESNHPLKSFVSASAIGWYGPDPRVPNPRPFTETDPSAPGFLGETCMLWEKSTEPVTEMGIRRVVLRIGIVLSGEGGAIREFVKTLRYAVAPILGGGRQVISWIHIQDLVSMLLAALDNPGMQGVYNAVSPNPVNNRTLMLSLARQRRKFFIPVPVPAFVLRIMLGAMSEEILKSATVSADKILTTGFRFHHETIDKALKAL